MLTLKSIANDLGLPLEPIGEGWNTTKTIRSVTVVESTDVSQWLRGGEFLLVSPQTLRRVRDVASFVDELVSGGARALAIKSPTAQDVPQALVARAQETHLPLFHIPEDVTYLQVMSPINEALIRDEQSSFFLGATTRYLLGTPRLTTDDLLQAGLPQELSSSDVVVMRTVFSLSFLLQSPTGAAALSMTRSFRAQVSERLQEMKEDGRILDFVAIEELNDLTVALFVAPGSSPDVVERVTREVGAGSIFSLGISERLPVTQAHSAYEQADFAFRTGESILEAPGNYRYDEVEFYELVENVARQRESAALFERVDALADHPQLVETLSEYFKSNEQLKPAAEKLFIHVNTLRYRLEQVQRLTGLDYSVTTDKVKLFLGLIHLNSRKASQ